MGDQLKYRKNLAQGERRRDMADIIQQGTFPLVMSGETSLLVGFQKRLSSLVKRDK